MPLIKVLNLSKEQTAAVAKDNIGELSKVTGAPEKAFTFFHVCDPLAEDDLVLFDIQWYPRDTAKMKAVAELLYNDVTKRGKSKIDVLFSDLVAERHYTNGKQFEKK